MTYRRHTTPDHIPAPPAIERRQTYRSYRRWDRPRRTCLGRSLALLLSIAIVLAAGGYILVQLSSTFPRTNILILGLDRRPEEGTVVRSDTIVLATFYPPDSRIGLLSIPRDLYVEIPGYGTNRINTAHFWGEAEAAGGGPPLAVQAVSQNFGVGIHHYVRVDFAGFRAIVDAAGGVDVVVDEPIVDEAYPTADYGTMRIEIPAGPQHMDGETALRYARSRFGASDFDRAQRQQQILVALAHRLLEPKVWPRLPILYAAVVSHLDTDMAGRDLLLLAPTLYRAGSDSIEHHVVDHEMTQPWTTPSGGAVLLPRWDVIQPIVHDMFTP